MKRTIQTLFAVIALPCLAIPGCATKARYVRDVQVASCDKLPADHAKPIKGKIYEMDPRAGVTWVYSSTTHPILAGWFLYPTMASQTSHFEDGITDEILRTDCESWAVLAKKVEGRADSSRLLGSFEYLGYKVPVYEWKSKMGNAQVVEYALSIPIKVGSKLRALMTVSSCDPDSFNTTSQSLSLDDVMSSSQQMLSSKEWKRLYNLD